MFPPTSAQSHYFLAYRPVFSRGRLTAIMIKCIVETFSYLLSDPSLLGSKVNVNIISKVQYSAFILAYRLRASIRVDEQLELATLFFDPTAHEAGAWSLPSFQIIVLPRTRTYSVSSMDPTTSKHLNLGS